MPIISRLTTYESLAFRDRFYGLSKSKPEKVVSPTQNLRITNRILQLWSHHYARRSFEIKGKNCSMAYKTGRGSSDFISVTQLLQYILASLPLYYKLNFVEKSYV